MLAFYNQSTDDVGLPTPTIGMLGVMDDKSLRMSLNFKMQRDNIFSDGRISE